jgi:hypothetical protein
MPNFARTTSPNPASDYFVFTRRLDQEFSWEISRRSRPIGVKVSGGGFRSRDAAGLAGRRALLDFLLALADEEARTPKLVSREMTESSRKTSNAL